MKMNIWSKNFQNIMSSYYYKWKVWEFLNSKFLQHITYICMNCLFLLYNVLIENRDNILTLTHFICKINEIQRERERDVNMNNKIIIFFILRCLRYVFSAVLTTFVLAWTTKEFCTFNEHIHSHNKSKKHNPAGKHKIK